MPGSKRSIGLSRPGSAGSASGLSRRAFHPREALPGRQPGTPGRTATCNRQSRPVGAGAAGPWEQPMAKKITGYVKLQVPAGAANPSPPIGPALGQRGLNIMEFCKAFNAKTAQMEKGTPDPGDHHRVSGPLLHLRDEAAAGLVLPQEGGEPEARQEAGFRLEDARQGRQRRQGHRGPDPRDRREEDGRPQLRHGRVGHGDDPRAPPGPWASKWWVKEGMMARTKESASAPPARASTACKLYPHRGRGEAHQGARQGQVRRDRSRSR